MDYSNSDYIPLMDGNTVIWKEFKFLRHSSDLAMYSEIVEETKSLMNQFPHMKKILESDIGHITSLLETVTIHHRQTRSLNILGTALKVVAGTPDFADFEALKFRQQEINESINRQAVINTRVQEKINNITESINIIMKSAKEKQIETGHLYENLLARNRMVISELEMLMLSITLAKIQIINPAMLDSEDLNQILKEHSTSITIADLMEVSSVTVLLDYKFIHFIIKYPDPSIVCKKVTLFPVQRNGTILHFAGYNNVADCEDKIVPIGNCTATLTATFCKELPFTTCAQQLHSGGIAQCNTRPSHLVPLEVVDDGIIIINDDTATVKIGNETDKLIHGTFLLTFADEVHINGSQFRNTKNIIRRHPGSAASTMLNITGHQEILSLPYLQRLNFDNLHYINNVEKKLMVWPTAFSVLTIIALVIGFLIRKRYQNSNKKKQISSLKIVLDTLRKTEDGLQSSKGGVNTSGQA